MDTTNKYAGVIYKATFKNGKSYIGKTKNFKQRKYAHYSSAYNPESHSYHCVFYNAIRKYGWNNIEWSIIEYVEKYEDLNDKEKYWIKYYNTYINWENSNGYNMTIGGEEGSAPEKFITQEDINYILNKFKENGSITDIAKELNCSYNTIRRIIQGEIRTDLTHLNGLSFYNQYRKIGSKMSQEIIKEILFLSEQDHSIKEISELINVNVKYIQDILSGRVQRKVTGKKRITREERQYYNPVNSKMKKEEVLQIVDEYYNQNKTIKEIAKLHNKHASRISEIVYGRTWNKVTGIMPKEKSKTFLKSSDVLSLVQESKKEKDINKLAEKYNITVRNVKRILSGETWNNLTHIKENKKSK